jgi:hypothetical protein
LIDTGPTPTLERTFARANPEEARSDESDAERNAVGESDSTLAVEGNRYFP